MRTTSTYIPIDRDFILLEYIYNSQTLSTKETGFLRIKNTLSGSISFLSYNPTDYQKSKDLTNNVFDVSVQQISETSWLHFDVDRPIRFFEQHNRPLYIEDLWNDIEQELYVTYNTLRIHVLRGYTFDDMAGIIARVAYVDNAYNQVFVANFSYLKEDTINYHTEPIRIGDKIYDRYIEVSFPTLSDVKDIDTQITESHKTNDNLFYINGIFPDVTNSKVNIILYEVQEYSTDTKGQVILRTVAPLGTETNGVVRREVELNDTFSGISAIISESVEGDYFELYPSYEGQFLEDYLQQRAYLYHESYIIIHDIDVYEQLYDLGGYSEIKTQGFTQIQTTNFQEPYLFRPIIRNNNTVAFTIEYTVRLYNQTNPSHIIRRASLTYPNAKKYGRYMDKLNFLTDVQPVRIVNKLLTENITNTLNTPFYKLPSSKEIVIESKDKIINHVVPIQYTNVIVNASTLFINKQKEIISDVETIKYKLDNIVNSNILYGQGDAILYINDFDNLVKFKIFKYIDDNDTIVPYDDLKIDSVTSSFYLIFEDKNGEKIKINQLDSITSTFEIKLEPGEIFFKIDSLDSKKILASPNNTFWITFENKLLEDVSGTIKSTKKNYEIVVYSGKVNNIKNYSSGANTEVLTKNEYIQKSVDKLNELKDDLVKTQGDIQKQVWSTQSDITTALSKLSNADVVATEKEILNKFKESLQKHQDILSGMNSKVIDEVKKLQK